MSANHTHVGEHAEFATHWRQIHPGRHDPILTSSTPVQEHENHQSSESSEWHVCKVDRFKSTVRPATKTKACDYLHHVCSRCPCLLGAFGMQFITSGGYTFISSLSLKYIKITSGACACPLVHALGNIIPRNHIAIWMELGSEWRVCQVDSFRSTVKRPTTKTKACVYLQHLCSSFLCLVT